MKKNVKVLSVALAIVISVGTLFSLTSFAATEETASVQSVTEKCHQNNICFPSCKLEVYHYKYSLMNERDPLILIRASRNINKSTLESFLKFELSRLEKFHYFDSTKDNVRVVIKNGAETFVVGLEEYNFPRDGYCGGTYQRLKDCIDELDESSPISITASISPKLGV